MFHILSHIFQRVGVYTEKNVAEHIRLVYIKPVETFKMVNKGVALVSGIMASIALLTIAQVVSDIVVRGEMICAYDALVYKLCHPLVVFIVSKIVEW